MKQLIVTVYCDILLQKHTFYFQTSIKLSPWLLMPFNLSMVKDLLEKNSERSLLLKQYKFKFLIFPCTFPIVWL